eukprot:4794431-Alexandrium_andersonii.AAC.1
MPAIANSTRPMQFKPARNTFGQLQAFSAGAGPLQASSPFQAIVGRRSGPEPIDWRLRANVRRAV